VGDKDMLCVCGASAREWPQELDALESMWPDSLQKVCSGQEALTLLEQRSFACVVVFPGLPDLDGQELVLRLRKAVPGVHVVLFLNTPERTADEVMGGKDRLWLYQKSCRRESHLPSLVDNIIRGEASENTILN